MAKMLKEPVTEKIEIVDQPEEENSKRGLRSWITIPLVLAVAALGVFFLVRRLTHTEEN